MAEAFSPQAFFEKAAADAADSTRKLDELLSSLNTFDVLANVMMSELLYNPETYSEPRFQGKSAYAEYVAQILLRRPVVEDRPAVFDRELMETIRSYLDRVFFGKGFESKNTGDESELSELAGTHAWEEMLVRGSAYANHAIPFFNEVAKPVEEWMLATLGFCLNDCFEIAQAYADCLADKYVQAKNDIQSRIDLIWGVYKARRKGAAPNTANLSEEDVKYLEHCLALPARQAFLHLRNREIVFGFSTVGTAILATSNELSERVHFSPERVQACLDFFSLSFGDGTIPLALQAVGPLRSKPVMKHEEHYILVSPQLMLWAALPALEAALNPDSAAAINHDRKLWETYASRKAALVESRSLDLIASVLPGAIVERNLNYAVNGEAGEVDGLVVFDKTLLIVETKSGAFSVLARRGLEKRLERDLTKLLGDAHEQALKCLNYLQTSPQVSFKRHDGSIVSLQYADFRRIVLITVTLENLSSFTTMLHRTAQTGLFPAGQLPWAVSLFDLQVIVEHCALPSQLIHYLRRRLGLNQKTKLEAHDELDWFGAYLSTGLLFGSELQEADMVSLGSFTEGFDGWYMYQSGERKTPAKKPAMAITPFWIDILTRMEGIHTPGWSEGALMLLDLSDVARKKAESRAKYCMRRVSQGKKPTSGHIATVGGGQFSFSLHYIADELRARLPLMRADIARKTGKLYCLSNLSLICSAVPMDLLSMDVRVATGLEDANLFSETAQGNEDEPA